MKAHALILLAFILVADHRTTAQTSIMEMRTFQKDISLSGLQLSGQVKKVMVQEYDIEDGSYDHLERKESMVYIFDDRGLDVEEYFYFPDGRLNYRMIIRYDESGNEIENELYNYTDKDSIKRKGKWTYDYQGHPVALDLYFNDEPDKQLTWRRDSNGNVLEHIVEVTDPELSGYHDEENTYFYDGHGNMTRRIQYVYGNLVRTVEFVYNNKGQLSEERIMSSNGVLRRQILYKYGDSSKLIRKTQHNYLHSGGYYQFTYIYDAQGNLIEESKNDEYGKIVWGYKERRDSNGNVIEEQSYSYGGGLLRKTSLAYDTTGNVIEILQFDSDGLLERTTSYTYEFDHQGNWIRKTEYRNMLPVAITNREIEYYR